MASSSSTRSTYGNDADRTSLQGAVANAQDSGICSAVCSGDRDRSHFDAIKGVLPQAASASASAILPGQ
ncbi:hypothetical protein INS49_008188 [Diaporthe citri]|uniref:uncharacterized protein n=1 Tax=Diaporthe citri TaxID=83186 RepID=UPI001C80FE7D|nr:uncharacterized protein INS49_008188 [Diaporthe citri]KAG6363093.1 hypothetical protein INS49_008188 [Diaporthe citri]